MQILKSGLSDYQDQIIREILSAALHAADPRLLVFQSLNSASLPENNIRVIAIGKAAELMVQGAVDALGGRILDGLVVTKHHKIPLDSRFAIIEGNHPIPGQSSLDAGMALQEFLNKRDKGSSLLFLISGGGSALATLPAAGISLDDVQRVTHMLLASGASIEEINVIRKHIDQLKGGGMLRLANSMQAQTLILSDVIGNSIESVASGPTSADVSTYGDAVRILQKYRVLDRVATVRDLLIQGIEGRIPETLKPGDPLLANVQNLIIGDNQIAVTAACEMADNLGAQATVLPTPLTGEARLVGVHLGEIARELARSQHSNAIVGGGETTVKVAGTGKGGRNLETALAAVETMAGLPDTVLVTFATDGEDGTTDAAGAVVTGDTYARGVRLGLLPAQYLDRNDSYTYFDTVGGLIKTGSTGTNANDLFILLRL